VNISQHPTTHAFPTFNFSAGTGLTAIGRDKAGITQSKTTQFSDNVTYTLGKHTLKGGIDIRRVQYFDLESFAPTFASDDFGSFIFQPTFTGNAFGDFLEGAPTTLNFAVSSPDVGGTATQYSLFAQDEYQVNSRLTLSYGLRWQMLPGFQEDGGNLANFDQRNNSIVVPDALAAYLTSQNITQSNVAFQQSFNACNLNNTSLPCTKYVTASQDGLPQSLRNTYKGNFQPRFSVAYRPFNDTRTVVRAGFGIYTMTNLGPLSFNNSGNPTSSLHTYSNFNTAGANTPQIRFPSTAPPTIGAQIGGGSLDQGVDPNYRDPQSNQWNVTVEREISNNTSIRASYVGMHTYRLSITEDLNQIPASTTAFTTSAAIPWADPRSPYTNWAQLFSTFNAGEANYRAFELEARHRMQHGLYLFNPSAIQFHAARQPHSTAIQHQHRQNPPAELHQHRYMIRRHQVQRGQRRSSHHSWMKAGGAERRFIPAHNLRRHHRRKHFDLRALAPTRLRGITQYGGVDVERHALLHAESHQRNLLLGVGREAVEIEHRHARAIVRQDERDVPPSPIAVHRRESPHRCGQLVGHQNIVAERRSGNGSRRERMELRLRRLSQVRAGDPRFRHFKSVSRRRISE